MANKRNKSLNFILTLSGAVIIIGIAIITAGILLPLDIKIVLNLSNLLLIAYLGFLIGYLISKLRS